MLDSEARREKILSAINKETRLKERAKNKMRVMMESGLLKRGAEDEEKEMAILRNQLFSQWCFVKLWIGV